MKHHPRTPVKGLPQPILPVNMRGEGPSPHANRLQIASLSSWGHGVLVQTNWMLYRQQRLEGLDKKSMEGGIHIKYLYASLKTQVTMLFSLRTLPDHKVDDIGLPVVEVFLDVSGHHI